MHLLCTRQGGLQHQKFDGTTCKLHHGQTLSKGGTNHAQIIEKSCLGMEKLQQKIQVKMTTFR